MPASTFQNLGFETAGIAVGSADGWTLAFQATAEEIAGYGPTPERPEENFERGWASNESFLFALPTGGLEPSLHDEVPESVEDFEEGWSQNESFLRELASISAADYDPGAGTRPVEDFDGPWNGNESFLFAFTPEDLAAAPVEPFETGWRSNESFLFAFGGGDLALGPTETFESGWTPMTTV